MDQEGRFLTTVLRRSKRDSMELLKRRRMPAGWRTKFVGGKRGRLTQADSTVSQPAAEVRSRQWSRCSRGLRLWASPLVAYSWAVSSMAWLSPTGAVMLGFWRCRSNGERTDFVRGNRDSQPSSQKDSWHWRWCVCVRAFMFRSCLQRRDGLRRASRIWSG
jgi:hypothetical protein